MRRSRRSRWLAKPSGRSLRWMAVAAPQGAGTELGLQAALQGLPPQSSSARQTVVAVQALQMARASSSVPSGSE